MKILLTHDRFAPDFAGGGELVVLETARHLLLRGIEVRVLTTGDPRITEYEGIPTRRLPIHRYRLNLASGRIVEAARWADLIHTFNYHACVPSLAAGRRLGKPVVCTILGLCGDAWTDMRGPIAGRAWRAWERFLVRRPYSRTAFLSEFSLEEGVRMGADRARALVTSPGIDADLYDASRAKDDVVLFVGKLDVRKGIHDVLAAARALPDLRFRLVGWGPEDEFRRIAPGNVEFAGLVRGEALREEFARARLFVLPSRGETFGIALLEAMASGCAIVSSIPLPFAGTRLSYGDRAALISGLRRLWDDRDEAGRLGAENARRAREFTWERYTATLLDTYAGLSGPGAPRT